MYDISQNPFYLYSVHRTSVFGERSRANDSLVLCIVEKKEILFIPLQNECFLGYTGISLSLHVPVCLSVCPSVYRIPSVKALVRVLSHII